MSCKNCAKRRICNEIDHSRGQACQDYISDKLKKAGYAFVAVGAISIFIICASEFEQILPQFLSMIAAGLAVLTGSMMLGGELDVEE